MSFEDAKRDWRGELDRPLLPDDLRERLVAVHRRCDQLERTTHWRDLTEIVAAVLVVAGFTAFWPIYRHSVVACVGAAIIILWAVAVIVIFLTARRPVSLPFDASVRDFSRHRLAWLDGQIRLVRTVPWWYVAPGTVGMLIMSWGLMDGNLPLFGFFILPALLLAAWVVSVNVRTVRRVLRPVRDDVARVLTDLEATGPAGASADMAS